MPTNIIINNNNFAYPSPGDEPGWGEAASGAMIEVAAVLSTIQGTDDIPETTFNVANNVSSSMDVTGLVFNPATVRSSVVDYSCYRTTSTTELAEKGQLQLIYKNGATPGTKWSIGRVFFGDDSGLAFTMTDAGQVQYTSTNLSGTSYTGELKFEAFVTQQ